MPRLPKGARSLGTVPQTSQCADTAPQRVWGLAKTDQGWSTTLEVALTAARRDDLEHGTNAAYVHGCVCRDCREHQQRRMGRR